MKIFTLHTGTWDSYSLMAVFSTKEKAEAYVKKFKIKDNPTIEEKELDPLDSIVSSSLIPYMSSCTTRNKVKLYKNNIHEFFVNNNVHFAHGSMYYYFMAKDDAQAIDMTEKMRKRFLYGIKKDWKIQSDEGEQIL